MAFPPLLHFVFVEEIMRSLTKGGQGNGGKGSRACGWGDRRSLWDGSLVNREKLTIFAL
jgi:hypothetical protein